VDPTAVTEARAVAKALVELEASEEPVELEVSVEPVVQESSEEPVVSAEPVVLDPQVEMEASEELDLRVEMEALVV